MVQLYEDERRAKEVKSRSIPGKLFLDISGLTVLISIDDRDHNFFDHLDKVIIQQAIIISTTPTAVIHCIVR